MKLRNLIPTIGAIAGAVGVVFTIPAIGGPWGIAAGFFIFFACSFISDRIWRRGATPEEIRRDLESRARDTF